MTTHKHDQPIYLWARTSKWIKPLSPSRHQRWTSLAIFLRTSCILVLAPLNTALFQCFHRDQAAKIIRVKASLESSGDQVIYPQPPLIEHHCIDHGIKVHNPHFFSVDLIKFQEVLVMCLKMILLEGSRYMSMSCPPSTTRTYWQKIRDASATCLLQRYSCIASYWRARSGLWIRTKLIGSILQYTQRATLHHGVIPWQRSLHEWWEARFSIFPSVGPTGTGRREQTISLSHHMTLEHASISRWVTEP